MIPKSSYPSDQKILRVVSINVNGLRSAEKKGIFDWIATSDADVICMQESRITHEQWTDKFKPEGWHTPCSLLNVQGMLALLFIAVYHLFQLLMDLVLNWPILKVALFRLSLT